MSNGDQPGAGPDPDTTLDEAQRWFDVLSGFGAGQSVSRMVSDHAAMHSAMGHVKAPSTAMKILAGIMAGVVNLTTAAVDGMNSVKDDPTAGTAIKNLTGAVMSDLLGFNVQLADSDAGSSQSVDAATTGKALFDALTEMFGGLQPISPAQGAANAQQFLGFGVNFSVVTAFLGFIGGLVPFLKLDELKGFGEEVRSTLGLGRLTHTAVSPLVHNMIAAPLDLWLKDILRPVRLAEAQLVRGLRAGLITEDVVRQGMAEKGYPDDAIDFLLTDFSVKLALSELYLLLLNGDIEEQDVINNLTLTGMPEDQAKLQLKASDLAAVKTQQTALLSWAESNYMDGFITEDQWNSILQNLMLSDLEETAIRTKVGWKQETPRKRVSFAEVKTAIVDNIVDFSYLDAWLTAEGYDQQSQLIMSFQVLEAIKTAENKVAFAKYKANVLRLANKPVPPWIVAAESTT
jgi:hypothetical protein